MKPDAKDDAKDVFLLAEKMIVQGHDPTCADADCASRRVEKNTGFLPVFLIFEGPNDGELQHVKIVLPADAALGLVEGLLIYLRDVGHPTPYADVRRN